MFFWLSEFSGSFNVLNVFRYLTFRAGAATVTALFFVLFFGAGDHQHAAPEAGEGSAHPRGGRKRTC